MSPKLSLYLWLFVSTRTRCAGQRASWCWFFIWDSCQHNVNACNPPWSCVDCGCVPLIFGVPRCTQDAKDAKIPPFGNVFQQPRCRKSKHRPPGAGCSGRTCVANLAALAICTIFQDCHSIEPNLCRCTCATRLFGKERLKFTSLSKGSFLASSFEEKQVVCATWTRWWGMGNLYFEVRLLPFACVPGFVLSLSV